MGLPWVRLDTSFPLNHKILALIQEKEGHRAAFVYTCSFSLCGAQGTDGFISRESLPFIHGRDIDAQRIVKHHLWVPQPGGWVIPDWSDFQQSTEETQLRSKRARGLAEMRWAGHDAQTDAQRAKAYRDRKKGQQSEAG